MTKGLDGTDGRRAPRRKAMSAARRRRFLDHLAATCNAIASAKVAGLSISTFYAHRQSDAAFKAIWEEAIQAGYERLEEALLARALESLQGKDAAEDPGGDTAIIGGTAGDAASAGKGGGRVSAKLALSDIQLALSLLNRRQAVEKRGTGGRRRASVQEVETALGAKLDSLARRLSEPER